MPRYDYEEIHEPVKMYKYRFRKEFADKASAFFEDILRKSKVDEAANANLVAEIDSLKTSIENLSLRVNSLIVLRAIFILVIVIAAVALIYNFSQDSKNYILALIEVSIIALSVYGIVLVNPRIKNFRKDLADARTRLREAERKAWDMMQPLNSQFQWETVNKIIMQTLSIMDIDRFFSRERARQLVDYGLEDFGDNCSVVDCQSGTINGNPWALVHVLSQEWTNVTYRGYLPISYRDEEHYFEDGILKSREVVRTQTLEAKLEAPAPVYFHNKFLFYGHYAAPDLTFSRKPVKIANDHFKRKNAIKKLEDRSRDPDKKFTITSNKDFDASFYAVNRNNEHQFALLYSALAQKATYDLLKDDTHGFGDDFSFQKKNKLNILSSYHLNDTDISLDPKIFRHYDLKYVRENFLNLCNSYFRSFYFSFAPLFCIPIYQQHDATKDVPPGDPGYKSASKFEYESLANYMGNTLAHPNAALPLIMKIANVYESGKVASVRVNAKSFSKKQYTKYISVLANNRKFYSVRVNYYLYEPADKFTDLKVCRPDASDSAAFEAMKGTRDWVDLVSSLHVDASSLIYRRGLAAFRSK